MIPTNSCMRHVSMIIVECSVYLVVVVQHISNGVKLFPKKLAPRGYVNAK